MEIFIGTFDAFELPNKSQLWPVAVTTANIPVLNGANLSGSNDSNQKYIEVGERGWVT